jgi:pilus assembly protein Flp/PilA
MKKFSKSFQAFWADEHGATAIEYGLLASLIAVLIVVPVTTVGQQLEAVFEAVSAALPAL